MSQTKLALLSKTWLLPVFLAAALLTACTTVETVEKRPVKQAVCQGKVKASPYVVGGKRYVPLSLRQAQRYEQMGIASWYGQEVLNKKGGHVTANGEAFNPMGLTAAHKHLPLPINVRVTNLENGRSIIVRVNDRGPFPSADNPDSKKRIIDVSYGAAKKLGFHKKGLARVHVKVIPVKSCN
ncbi:MAG: septal ring lytic transglycosylase RlpA family protein [Nitrospira sp. SB0672_bin_25]|nr:septal ring lytic transglycosylase RlpA family protein [Nitrospira sp. SB0666_bin_27]MYF24983.1 septal ring lytic transglycosylase RlpA family protein [Nitrospira sp. SB0678_bin_10]MYJ54708.1 septal ring lytic transglycosylase RlpA family protein [Nitrospira sp. SB0672_bin_25]